MCAKERFPAHDYIGDVNQTLDTWVKSGFAKGSRAPPALNLTVCANLRSHHVHQGELRTPVEWSARANGDLDEGARRDQGARDDGVAVSLPHVDARWRETTMNFGRHLYGPIDAVRLGGQAEQPAA